MSAASPENNPKPTVTVRPLQESDLAEARAIFRLAFGTFLGLPDPQQFAVGREYISTRWQADPSAALAADLDGVLAGSNFAINWGSFGFFGPLTIRPELWNRGIAQNLLAATMDIFERWETREAGLFTFANSPKHVCLYQKFGFWPRFLTALMSKPVQPASIPYVKYSQLTEPHQAEALDACRRLTDAIYEGLDVTGEIRSVQKQHLGETLLLWGGDRLEAFAVCHCGEGTEAGADNCYVKFAAVRPSPEAERSFDHLLNACETFAAESGLHSLEVGVNLHRTLAYRRLLQRGFRTLTQGVSMHKPNSAAYNREDVYLLDDLR